MNRRTAIEKTIVIWQWMVDNNRHSKDAALQACFPKEHPLFSCYLCEFAGTTNEFGRKTCDCAICPVWPAASPDACHCEEGSDYEQWVMAGIEPYCEKTQHQAALRVIADCKSALSNLKES